MSQFINEFIEYCQKIGILKQDDSLQLIDNDLTKSLFMNLITLNKQTLLELATRIVSIWESYYEAIKLQNNNNSRQISQYYAQTSSHNTISNPNGSIYLYEQYARLEENKLLQSQKFIKKELEQCTFKPQICQKSSELDFNQPVHQRLHQFAADQKIKQQIKEEIKTNNEIKHCTFRPSINESPQKLEGDAFSRLYQNAQQQQKIHNNNNNSVDKSCTFSPNLVSQQLVNEQYSSIPVNERLYNHYIDQQQDILQKKEQNIKKEMEGCTFVPQINTSIINCDSKVFDRLYNIQSAKKSVSEIKDIQHKSFSTNRKSNKIIKNGSNDISKYVSQFSIESNPFQRLHDEHQRQNDKKKKQENDFFNNIPFQPYLNKQKMKIN